MCRSRKVTLSLTQDGKSSALRAVNNMVIKQVFTQHVLCASIRPSVGTAAVLAIDFLVTHSGAKAPRKEASYVNKRDSVGFCRTHKHA